MATPNPASPNHAAWGVSETLPDPYASCVITDWSETEEPQHQYEYDQQGAVIGDTVYDRRFALSLTVQIPKNQTHPKTGSTLTLRKNPTSSPPSTSSRTIATTKRSSFPSNAGTTTSPPPTKPGARRDGRAVKRETSKASRPNKGETHAQPPAGSRRPH